MYICIDRIEYEKEIYVSSIVSMVIVADPKVSYKKVSVIFRGLGLRFLNFSYHFWSPCQFSRRFDHINF